MTKRKTIFEIGQTVYHVSAYAPTKMKLQECSVLSLNKKCYKIYIYQLKDVESKEVFSYVEGSTLCYASPSKSKTIKRLLELAQSWAYRAQDFLIKFPSHKKRAWWIDCLMHCQELIATYESDKR